MFHLRKVWFICVVWMCLMANGMTFKTSTSERNQTTVSPNAGIANVTASTPTQLLNNESTAKAMELALLETFINLHVKACGHLQLCTLETESEFSHLTGKDPSECCQPCSCDDRCHVNGNCCPDYNLFKTFGNKTFDNITDFLHAVRNSELSELDVETSEALEGECVRMQTGSIDEPSPPGPDYRIITSCLENYTEIPARFYCENPRPEFYDHIPVYSEQTLKTYKNIHCLICNNVSISNNLTFWQPIVRIMLPYFHFMYFDNLNALFKYLQSRKYYNLVFQPEDVSIQTEKCTLVTKASCSEENDFELNSTRNLQQICERFYSPVNKNYIERQTYRNVACYYCNKEDNFAKTCFEYYPDWPKYSIYIDMSHQTQTAETLDITFDTSDACARGFMLDIDKAVCRKVLCPRGFYIVNGRCSPMFGKVTGASYKTMLRVDIDYKIRQEYTNEILATVINESLSRVLTETLDSFKFGIFEKENSYFLIYLIFSFEDNTGSFPKAVDVVSTFAQSHSQHIAIRNSSRIPINISLPPAAYEVHTGQGSFLFDLTTGRKLITWKPVLEITGVKIPITRANFCYRIRLNQTEMVIGLFFQIVKQSSHKIALDDVETDTDDNRIVCMGDLKEHVDDSTTAAGTASPNDVNDPSIIDIEKGLIALAAMLLLLVVVVCLRKTFKNSL